MNNNDPITASFTAWLATRQHHGLPWQTDVKELREAYAAGYNAVPNAAIVQMEVSSKCQAGDAGSTPAGSAITADDVYKAYPRKIGKQAALKAITKAAKTVGMDRLLQVTTLYAVATAKWKPEEKQYIPHPATWYNRGSYDDDPNEWERGTAITSQFSRSH